MTRGALAPSASRPRRGLWPLIRTSWTPEEAEGWSREDAIAIVLSPIVYGLLLFGLVDLLLLRASGLAQLLLAAVLVAIGYRAIDPKLRAASADYESRQAEYALRLEQGMRWDREGD